MLPTQASHISQAALKTVSLGLQAVRQGEKLSAGRQSYTDSLASRVWAYLCDLYHGTTNSDITHQQLSDSADGLYRQVLQAKLNDSGHFDVTPIDTRFSNHVTFTVGNHQFVLQESVDNQSNYTLHFSEGSDSVFTDHFDPPANGTKIMQGMSISQFKVACLKEHIRQHREQGQITDLTKFDFNGMDLSGVDFYGTEISQDNMRSIAARGGNLTGASFGRKAELTAEDIAIYQAAGGRTVEGAVLKDVRQLPRQIGAKDLKLDKLLIDKNMALALIKAGVDPQKAFVRYLETARMRGARNVDVSGFDLSRIELNGVSLRGIEPLDLRVALQGRQHNLFNRVKNARESSNGPISTEKYEELRRELNTLHANGIVIKKDDLPDYNTGEMGQSYIYTSPAENLDKSILEDIEQFYKLAGYEAGLRGASAKPIGVTREGTKFFGSRTLEAVVHRSIVNSRWYKKKSGAAGAIQRPPITDSSSNQLRRYKAANIPLPKPVTPESAKPSPGIRNGLSSKELRRQRAAIPHLTRPVRPVPLKSAGTEKSEPANVNGDTPESSKPVAPPNFGRSDPSYKANNEKPLDA